MLNIDYVKGRRLLGGKEVYIYRNLNMEGVWYSIKQNGVVIGHTQNILLAQAKFLVSERGRQRVLDTGVKNVHAYIKGYVLTDSGDLDRIKQAIDFVRVTYNPRLAGHFLISTRVNMPNWEDAKPLGALVAELNNTGVLCYGLMTEVVE